MLVRDNSEDLRWQLGSSHGSCYLIATQGYSRSLTVLRERCMGRAAHKPGRATEQSGRGLRWGVAWRQQKRTIEQQHNVVAQLSDSLELHFVSNMMQ